MPARSSTGSAASGARSRSPRQENKRFSDKNVPELKTWVLVITEANPAKRRWKDAVPALVSKVNVQKTLETPKGHALVNVLVPNLFVLQHSFKGGKGFSELLDLKMTEIRPFTGDRKKVEEALLKAVAQHAKSRNNMAILQDELCDAGADEEEVEAPAEDKAEMTEATEDPEALATMDDEEAVAPEEEQEEEEEAAEAEAPQEKEEVVKAPVEDPNERSDVPEETSKSLPGTPQKSQKKSLTRRVTPLTPELDNSLVPQVPHAQEPKGRTGKALKPFKADPAKDKRRLVDLTRVISRAFTDAGESCLSREDIAKEVAAKLGMDACTAELDNALMKLDAANKIMLQHELVFLIA